MKKILFTIIVFGYSCFLNAQVLYNETFDNYVLGNVFTSVSTSPGQGNWHFVTGALGGGDVLKQFQIENEPNKGKVLTIATGPVGSHGGSQIKKTGFDVLWNQRTPGNNVLKFEFDMFVPNYSSNISNPNWVNGSISLLSNFKILAGGAYTHSNGMLRGVYFDGLQSTLIDLAANNSSLYVTKNRWCQLICYVDYNSNTAYIEIPAFSIVKKTPAFDKLIPPDHVDNYPPTDLRLNIGRNINATNEPASLLKFDNIKMTALRSVPSHLLNVNNFLAVKFNLYPNPTTNVVNITSSENMLVQQSAIYDVTGKLINTQKFNNEAEIQLNVEHLASGTYMLHLRTNEGTAVKKLIKK